MQFFGRGGVALAAVTCLAIAGLSSPASAEPFSYSSTDVPKSIPPGPGGSGQTLSSLLVPDFGKIRDLNVYVLLSHAWTAELDIYLIHSDTGLRVKLFDNYPGGTGIDMTFDDEAASPASGAGPTYTGTFRPAVPLGFFDGESIQGTWVLRIDDEGFGGRGTLYSWGIHGVVTTPEPGSMALFGMGLAGMAGYLRRRRKQRQQEG
jgi:subtilisin-like proprotein convertase family protein